MSAELHAEYERLMKCFPRSGINARGEFIAHYGANVYFNLFSCEDELEIKCKVLEWLSRAAHKSQPFASDRKNRTLWETMRAGINEYLGTSFSADDMAIIYTYLGNGCNRQRTIQFIQSGCDVSYLKFRRFDNGPDV